MCELARDAKHWRITCRSPARSISVVGTARVSSNLSKSYAAHTRSTTFLTISEDPNDDALACTEAFLAVSVLQGLQTLSDGTVQEAGKTGPV